MFLFPLPIHRVVFLVPLSTCFYAPWERAAGRTVSSLCSHIFPLSFPLLIPFIKKMKAFCSTTLTARGGYLGSMMWSICRGVELEGECVAARAPGVCSKPAAPGSAHVFAVICRRESKLKLKAWRLFFFFSNYHWVIKRTCAWLKPKKKKISDLLIWILYLFCLQFGGLSCRDPNILCQ